MLAPQAAAARHARAHAGARTHTHSARAAPGARPRCACARPAAPQQAHARRQQPERARPTRVPARGASSRVCSGTACARPRGAPVHVTTDAHQRRALTPQPACEQTLRDGDRDQQPVQKRARRALRSGHAPRARSREARRVRACRARAPWGRAFCTTRLLRAGPHARADGFPWCAVRPPRATCVSINSREGALEPRRARATTLHAGAAANDERTVGRGKSAEIRATRRVRLGCAHRLGVVALAGLRARAAEARVSQSLMAGAVAARLAAVSRRRTRKTRPAGCHECRRPARRAAAAPLPRPHLAGRAARLAVAGGAGAGRTGADVDGRARFRRAYRRRPASLHLAVGSVCSGSGSCL
jgi:hypothetical protein